MINMALYLDLDGVRVWIDPAKWRSGFTSESKLTTKPGSEL